MAKKKAALPVDVIAIAEACEARAKECAESLTALADQFTIAASALRKLHAVLSEEECRHMFTFTVTKAMIDSGRETRAIGKYCMTCGEALVDPPKPPKESDSDTGEEDASA